MNLDNIIVTDIADPSVAITANAIHAGAVSIDSRDFEIQRGQLGRLRDGEAATFSSSAVLQSNSTYDYSIAFLDRFGNELPLTAPVTGTVITCYQMPEARVTLERNNVADVRVNTRVTNEDSVTLSDLKLVLYGSDGQPVRCMADGESEMSFEHPVSENETLRFSDLAPSSAFSAVVSADFDLLDGAGMQNDAVLGQTKFSTLSHNALGYAFFTGAADLVTESSFRFTLQIDAIKTNPLLVFLMDSVTVSVKNGSETLSFSIEGDEAGGALYALKNGGDYDGELYDIVAGALVLDVTGLTSVTEYTVSVASTVAQGGRRYDINSSFEPITVKTLRRMPEARIFNAFSTESYIELYGVEIFDPDGAIPSTVSVMLYDPTNRVVAMNTLSPNEVSDVLRFENLEEGSTYTVRFVARELNRGYTNATARSLVELTPIFTVSATASVRGELTLSYLGRRDEATGISTYGNLFDSSTATRGKYINPSGVEVRSANYFFSDYIPVVPGFTYGVKGTINSASIACTTSIYDADRQLISCARTDSAWSVTVPQNGAYIRISGWLSLIDRAELFLVDSPGFGRDLTCGVGVSVTDTVNITSADPNVYLNVYKNGVREATHTLSLTGGALDTVKDVMLPLAEGYVPDSYYFELTAKVYGHTVLLDTLTVSNESSAYIIRDSYDFAAMSCDLDGRYILENDITLTYRCESDIGYNYVLSIITPFSGVFEGNGHTIYRVNSNNNLFRETAAAGEVRNLVVEVPENNPNVFTPLIGTNRGQLHDVTLKFHGYGTADAPVNGSYLFASTNAGTGVIEDFVIDLGGDFYVRSAFCTVAYSRGAVRNGCLVGGDVYITPGNAYSGQQHITPLIYYLYGGSTLENVYHTCDVYVYGVTSASSKYISTGGSTVYGTVRNVIAASDIVGYMDAAPVYGWRSPINKIKCDMFLGGALSRMKNVYSYTSYTTDDAYVQSVGAQTMHDDLWYDYVLNTNGGFNIEPVTMGYWPHVKQSACMPAQSYYELPTLTEADVTQLSYATVTEQYDEYAIALFSFVNPSGYVINEIAVEYLNCTVLSQVNEDGMSRVMVRVDLNADGTAPVRYKTGYSVYSYTRGTAVPGNTVVTYFDEGDFLLGAEFFKPVSTARDWTAIAGDPSQNYRLTNDIDLSALPAAQVTFYSRASNFSGKLDGRGFTVSNLDLASKYFCVFYQLTGELSNITFDGIRNLQPNVRFNALCYSLVSPGSMKNVHVRNASFAGMTYVGALVCVSSGSLDGCSATNVTATGIRSTTSSNSPFVGGLVGSLSTGSELKNSYSSASVVSTATSSTYAGGLVGAASNASIENCYSTGSVDAVGMYSGGLAGYVDGCAVSGCYSAASVFTRGDGLAGLFGYVGSTSAYNCLSVGDVYTTISTAEMLGRIVSMPNGSSFTNCAAFSAQLICGAVPLLADGVTPDPMDATMDGDATGLLDYSALTDVDTYIYGLSFNDEDYDFAPLERGALPWLYSDGELLPFQEYSYLRAESEVRVRSIDFVELSRPENRFRVQVTVEHPEGVTVTGVSLEYLNSTLVLSDPYATYTNLVYEVTPERYLDSYVLNAIHYEANGAASVAPVVERVYFDRPLYMNIASAAEWELAMQTRSASFENFIITGTLDFAAVSTPTQGINLNRLDGQQRQTVRNLNITGAGGMPVSWLSTVVSSLSYLSFEDCTVTRASGSGNYTGIVERAGGRASELSFTDCSAHGYSYVGMIARSEGLTVDGVTAERVAASGSSTDVASLFPYFVRGSINNVVVTDCSATQRSTGARTAIVVGETTYSVLGNMTASECTVNGAANSSVLIGLASSGMTVFPGTGMTVEDSDVTGAGSVGAIAGYSSCGWYTSSHNVGPFAVRRTNVTGTGSYVGGVVGSGFAPYGVVVEDCTVIGSTNYVGGVIGNQSSGAVDGAVSRRNTVISYGNYVGGIIGFNGRGSNLYVEDCRVFGSANVGGALGQSTATVSKTYVENTLVSTIYSAAFEAAGYDCETVLNPETQNVRVGGLCGQVVSSIAGVGVTGCEVVADDGADIGGLAGVTTYSTSANTQLYQSFVSNTTVTGAGNVGGIAGSARMVTTNNLFVDAVVMGDDAVGGVYGRLIHTYEGDPNNVVRERYISRSIVNCTLSGDTNVGGLIGVNEHPLTAANVFDIFLAVNVSGAAESANAVSNNLSDIVNVRVYENSPVNGARASLPTGASFISRESVLLYNYGTNIGFFQGTRARGGLALSVSTFSVDEPRSGNYPRTLYGGAVQPHQPLVAIPDWAALPERSAPLAVQSGGPLPTFEVYASGADTVNIEFSETNPYALCTVSIDGERAAEFYVEERVYTLSYGFANEISVEVTNGVGTERESYRPRELSHSLALYDGGYYYISDDGVRSASGLIAGDFVNIFGGLALSRSGLVYGLSDGAVKRSLGEEALLDTAKAVFDGGGIRMFKSFSLMNGRERPLQAFMVGGNTFALDPATGHVFCGVIAGVHKGASYLTVLMEGGYLADLHTALTTPEGFRNSGITEVAFTAFNDEPWAFVKYETGKVMLFDFTTGEELSLEYATSDLSFFSYALDFLAGDTEELETSEGYIKIIELMREITVEAPEEALISGELTGGADAPDGETAGGETVGGDSAGNGDSADGGDAAGGENVGGETVGGDAAGGENVGGEPVGGETAGGESVGGESVGGESVGGETVGGEPAGGETVGGETVGGESVGGEPAGGDNVGGESAGGESEGGEAAGGESTGGDTVGGGAAGGEAAEPVVGTLIPVFSAEAGGYVVYQLEELMSADEAVSVNDKLAGTGVIEELALDTSANPRTLAARDSSIWLYAAIFGGVGILIIVLLAVTITRKNGVRGRR